MPSNIPRMRMLPPATKKIETAIGMIIRRAPRSGCKKTSIIGTIIARIKGINPCCVSARVCLYRLQNDATVRIIESFRNSVG